MSESVVQNDFGRKIEKSLNQNENVLIAPNYSQIVGLNRDFIPYFKGNGKGGYGGNGTPDFFYYNPHNNLIIMSENKHSMINHGIEKYDVLKMDNPVDFALDGLIHYMKPFINSKYNVIGIAQSGDINTNYLLDTFIIQDGQIINKDISYLYKYEKDYMNLFKTANTDKAIDRLSKAISVINNNLRDIPTNDRPTLLSGIIISLYYNDSKGINKGNIRTSLDFDNIINNNFIMTNLIPDIVSVLKDSGITGEKNDVVKKLLDKILSQPTLSKSDIIVNLVKDVYCIMDILIEEHEFDVMANFYQEFLRYATGDGQDLGIILTPMHVTELMVFLLNHYSGGIREDDIILDPCTGTGTFLTTFMNFQINTYARKNENTDKVKELKIKENNLVGFEISPSMYTLAVANMLVRGDGKSKIEIDDFFRAGLSVKTKNGRNPNFGLMNPPFSQSKKKVGNNHSEMEFIERLLDKIDDGYAAVIVPKSTLFKQSAKYKVPKQNIYKKHTLKCVIGMPNNLFEPTASTNTAIAVFKTDKPHHDSDYVYFYDLNYDGFDVSRNGRKDLRNIWKNEIFPDIKKSIITMEEIESKSIVINELSDNDEWIPEAWLPTDFSSVINDGDQYFDKTIKEYALFKFKEKTGILDKEIEVSNEKDDSKKEQLKDKIPKNLELFELIQESGLNALDIIGEGNE